MKQISGCWLVQIQGHPSDLDGLEEHFSDSGFRIKKDADCYLYDSNSFETCRSYNEVLEVAKTELAILTGALRLEGLCREPLQAGSASKINASGGKDIFVHIEEGVYARATCNANLMVIDSDGNLIPSDAKQVPRPVKLMALASTEQLVAKALRLKGAIDSKTWVGLYRVLEVVIEDVGSEKRYLSQGWGSKNDFKRFMRSANSDSVAGDDARHGRKDLSPPKEPMTIDEAQAYVNYVIESWLASKLI